MDYRTRLNAKSIAAIGGILIVLVGEDQLFRLLDKYCINFQFEVLLMIPFWLTASWLLSRTPDNHLPSTQNTIFQSGIWFFLLASLELVKLLAGNTDLFRCGADIYPI